jgi:signal transduction histidine kinase/ligand-binding sensor domain-containing protein/DNA-binding response OmpR family regulator
MRIVLTRIIFLFLLLFIALLGKAEYDYVFEHLSTKDGLSHGSVSAMLKDRKGFMWFATWDGINRYDGYTFKTFKPGNGGIKNFSSNRIETMKEDSLGNIWVLTFDSKLFRFDRFTEEFTPIPNDIGDSIPVTINGFYIVSSGDVWVATSNKGAFRVVTDTVSKQINLINYCEKSEIPLQSNNVHLVFEDIEKRIWITTSRGVTCLEPSMRTKELKEKSFPSQTNSILNSYHLTAFYNTSALSYFGTDEGLLLVYNSLTDVIRPVDIKNRSVITCITGSSKGLLYIGTGGNGIIEFNEWTGQMTNHYSHPSIQHVLKMYADSKGLLWIESNKAGIAKIDFRNGSFRHYEQSLGVSQDIRPKSQCGFMEDASGKLWLTLKGGGFGFYNPATDNVEFFFNKPDDPESKISNFVNCFYKDPSGVLWMSTYFKGIDKVTFIEKKFQITQLAPQSNLSIANEVRAMMEDSKGLLWVATKKQELFLFDKNFNIVKKIDELNGEKTGTVYAIMEDSKGNIFLGTKGNGLYKLKRSGLLDFEVKHFIHYPTDSNAISNNNIYSLLEDKQGRIWVGTYGGGINMLVNDQFFHCRNVLRNYPSDKGNRVRHIAEDCNGNIWIGTTDGVVFMNLKGGLPSNYSFTLYSKEKGNALGLLSNDIFWIFCDKHNAVWIASLGGGLARLENYPSEQKPLEFSVLTRDDGLSSDVVFTITSDENENLWMSTENGISFYDPSEKVFRNYGQYDGAVNTGFSEAAIATRSDGKICVGANNGFYSFQPSSFNFQPTKAAILFTGFQLFGKEIIPGKTSVLTRSITETNSIRLKYNQNVFTVSWAGLDYKMQGKLQYACKLEGFDNDWVYVNYRNQATYTKLPPGKYLFRVKFSNAELQKLNEPVTIAIEILPPFWKTIWAYILLLFIAIIIAEMGRRIIFNMIRLRNKVVVEKELTDIKLNFFTNISHELRTPLTLILGPAKELKTNESLSPKGQNYIDLIEHNATRLLRLVNQLLDFRKIQSNKMELIFSEVELVQFTKSVCANFEELALEKSIHFSVQNTVDRVIIEIDEEKMEGVLFNLLSNAFKFTPADGSVDVLIKYDPEKGATIEIKDSGIGVSKEQEASLFEIFASHNPPVNEYSRGTGIGLALSKELLSLHDGELSYTPTPGGGATFCIRLRTCTENKVSVECGGIHLDKHEATLTTANIERNNRPLILIVEDNHELRNFLRFQLDDEYNIEEAENGRDGLEKSFNLQPDIILTDLMMPGMDGIELLDKIKNNFDTSHIPVVLLTAKTSVKSKVEGLKYGADAYLTKPFSVEQLKAQLANLLHQRILLREHFSQQPKASATLPGNNLTNRDLEFLNQVKSIIEDNLAKTDFKIEDIYKKVGMGRSKFSDKLKGLTGLSPIDFVTGYRLGKASVMLQSGEYNVTEVSYLSGFSEVSYFSKCFKEHFGVSPSHYAKKP